MPARRCCHFDSCRVCGMPDACSTLARDAYMASVIVSYTCGSSNIGTHLKDRQPSACISNKHSDIFIT